MFEARLVEGVLLKKLLDAIKDLVTDGNFEVSATDIQLQAMDPGHVSLVSMKLQAEGFEHYRCDRTFTMGLNMGNLSKVLKCASNDDVVSMKADEQSDVITFMFESKAGDRVSEFSLKQMDLNSENLGIPDTDADAVVRMPATDFQRICRDLGSIGDSVEIAVTKDGVKFNTPGEIGNASIVCRQHTNVDKPEEATTIHLREAVTLGFALKHLNSFCKATSLSPQVVISLTKDLPMVVEYRIADLGYIRYYLAPKIEDDAEMGE